MTEDQETPTAEDQDQEQDHVELTPVTKCLHAVLITLAEAERLDYGHSDIKHLGRMAYHNAMPRLDSSQHIVEFIDCVIQGILFDFIDEKLASKLFYGAQVALTACGRSAPPKSTKAKRLDNELITERLCID